MFLFMSAFFAGVITVFAPCVFALLPVIVGGSISGNVHDRRRPLIITASLAISLFVFTLLLKVTSLFINVSPSVITYVSGGIIVGVGLLMLFPQMYERLIVLLNLQVKSQQLLGKGAKKGAVIGAIITGAALGPVFSSCSPVYAYILATVLPAHFIEAVLYMVAYIVGLSTMLLLIGFVGQKLVRRLKWASNPRGWFTRTVAVLFIVVGLLVMTGYDKQLQVYISAHTPFDFDALSSKLLPTAAQSSTAVSSTGAQAPEFVGLTNWVNSPPLTLASLKGKVVLVDFWTYSCINCIRTQPFLKSLYANYKDSGFVIVGVHAPEFSFEKNPDNVKAAVKQDGLLYPIAQDNDLQTWAAFQNQYWPASYLIDKQGHIRYTHFGEGGDKATESAVRSLLAENGGSAPSHTVAGADNVPTGNGESPETYFGSDRASGYVGVTDISDGTHDFSVASVNLNKWSLGGTWHVSGEGITAVRDSILRFHVAAKDVYVVTGANQSGTIDVILDGKPISQTGSAGEDITDSKITVDMAQLYRAVHFDTFRSDATVELHVSPGVQLNTFTFGG